MELKKVKKSRKVIFAVLSVICIILSFLSPITVRAAENNGSLIDDSNLGFTTDDILNNEDSDFSQNIFIDTNSSDYTNLTNIMNGSGFSITKYQSGDFTSDYGVMYRVNNSEFYFQFLYSDSLIFITGSNNNYKLHILMPVADIDSSLESNYHYKYSRFNVNSGAEQNPYAIVYSSNYSTVNIDSVSYYDVNFNTSTQLCLMTTNPIYYNSVLPSSLEGLDQLNYTGAYSGEVNMVEEHYTLREGSGIYLNNSNCNDGTVYIVVIPDEYQTNENGFKIRYTCQCSYVLNIPNYSNSTDIGIYRTLSRYGISGVIGTNSISNAQYYYNDYAYNELNIDSIGSNGIYEEDFKVTNERLKYNGTSISYIASTVASDGNWTKTATNGLATAGSTIRNVGAYGISIGVDTSRLASLVTDTYTIDNISYTFALSLVKDGEVVATQYYPFTLYSSSGITGPGEDYGNLIGSDSDYEAAGTKNMGEGEYNQDYSPRNDISVTGGGGSSSSSNNSSQGGSGGDANVTNTEGDNNVVVNTGSQNVTVNNDNGTAKYVPTILNKLLPNSEGDGGLSNDVQDLVNSNGWVTFMKTTYSFIPAAFWDKIVLYFGACLTITACAFLLRIILDLL